MTITFPDGWSGIQSRTENGTVVFMMPVENSAVQDDRTPITLSISKTEALSDEG
ncbi:hypothetical protein NTE_03429 [Candidatus Nitrososphaera evergladensis SR1]|uniref:Uncharacterized protein n=1 Tax=Candidatus Nitrososphaera evergladensis SR1 TaxID=1459636 RepID=A0A075MXW0_9ARCH|nr:hypothetical protein NTE_03429 [Candidatus Nitrososphaera evergladensis SR1]